MTRANIFPFLIILYLSALPVLSIHLPRALSFLPLLIGLIASLWWVLGKKEKLTHNKTYTIIVLALIALTSVSCLWSLNTADALEKAGKIAAILLASIPLFNLMRSININDIRPFLWLFPAGVTSAALLCAYELSNDLPLYQIIRDVGENYEVNTSVMNRGVVATIFGFFASLLCIKHLDQPKYIKAIIITIMTGSILMMLSETQSQSAQLAFIIGISALFVFPHQFQTSYILLSIALIATLLATPAITNILYTSLVDSAQNIPWLQDGYAGHRIEIWNFVMEYALKSPLYGHGLEATRFVTDFDHEYIHHEGASILHPHNFAVQLWIEFGLIGILTASALIITLMNISKALPKEQRRITTALFLSVLSVSAMGYGMWQSWWIGEIILLVGLCALLTEKEKA